MISSLWYILFWLIAQQVLLALIPIPGYIYFHQMIPLLFLYLMRESEFKDLFCSKPCVFFVLLVIYHMINCYCQVDSSVLAKSEGFSSFVALWNSVTPNALILCLVPYLLLLNEKKTHKFILAGYVVFIIVGIILLRLTGDSSNRMKGGVIHPNALAQACGMGLMYFAYLKYRYSISYIKLLFFSILPIMGIILSTSRNGFSLVAIFFLTVCVAPFFSKENNTESHNMRISVIILAVIVFFSLVYVLDNTEVGGRIKDTDETTVTELETGTPLDFLGERAWYYYFGWKDFLENPFFGIGLWHFQTYNDFAFPLHSEYMIHIAEGGTLGALLYFSFVFYVLYFLLQILKQKTCPLNFVLLMMFFSYLFVGVTAREFYNSFFYPLLGVIVFSVYKSRQLYE